MSNRITNYFRNSSQNRINTQDDTLTTALCKKKENKTLSAKTIRKLIQITQSRYKLSKQSATQLFEKNNIIITDKGTEICNELLAARNLVESDNVKKSITVWIDKLKSGNWTLQTDNDSFGIYCTLLELEYNYIKTLCSVGSALRNRLIDYEKERLRKEPYVVNRKFIYLMSICDELKDRSLWVNKVISNSEHQKFISELPEEKMNAFFDLFGINTQNRTLNMLNNAGILRSSALKYLNEDAIKQDIHQRYNSEDIHIDENAIDEEFNIIKSDTFLCDWLVGNETKKYNLYYLNEYMNGIRS